jgi:3-dehydrosphinganine reductase
LHIIFEYSGGTAKEMRSFNDKNVYITGGSSGIGFSVAKLLSSLGANIILFARNKKRMEDAIEEIKELKRDNNQSFSFMRLDVRKNGEVKATMDRAVITFGKPDILINSAGIVYPDYFERISYRSFNETIKTNLYGTRNVIASLLSPMKETGGYIINVSSLAGFISLFGYTSYCASKFAIIGFSECLRSELKRFGITVSVLCPPDTDTPMLQEETRIRPAEARAIASSAKVMNPSDVARSLIKGIRKGRFVIIPNRESRFIWLAKRLFPSLVERIMDIQIRKIQK